MECFVLLCHVGEGPVPTALVIIVIYINIHINNTCCCLLFWNSRKQQPRDSCVPFFVNNLTSVTFTPLLVKCCITSSQEAEYGKLPTRRRCGYTLYYCNGMGKCPCMYHIVHSTHHHGYYPWWRVLYKVTTYYAMCCYYIRMCLITWLSYDNVLLSHDMYSYHMIMLPIMRLSRAYHMINCTYK